VAAGLPTGRPLDHKLGPYEGEPWCGVCDRVADVGAPGGDAWL